MDGSKHRPVVVNDFLHVDDARLASCLGSLVLHVMPMPDSYEQWGERLRRLRVSPQPRGLAVTHGNSSYCVGGGSLPSDTMPPLDGSETALLPRFRWDMNELDSGMVELRRI